MGKIVLVNDLPCDLFDAGLFVGQLNPEPTDKGKQYAPRIAKSIHKHSENLTEIYASDAKRVSYLVHHLRVNSKYLMSRRVNYTTILRERCFGVLDGTLMPNLSSDLFKHSRITGEQGESASQCRDRVLPFLDKMDYRSRCVLVSHPFLCQIICNILLDRNHTILTSFWLSPGSFVVFDTKIGQYKCRWMFDHAHNAILNRDYTKEQIYSDILGK